MLFFNAENTKKMRKLQLIKFEKINTMFPPTYISLTYSIVEDLQNQDRLLEKIQKRNVFD